jgi:hypothetical protein
MPQLLHGGGVATKTGSLMTEVTPENTMESRPKKHSSNASARLDPSRRSMLKVKRSILKKLFARIAKDDRRQK